jgi:hypothetical protein
VKSVRFYKLSEDSDSLNEQLNTNLCNKEFLNILCDCHCFPLYLYLLCARQIGTVQLILTCGGYYLRDVMLCSLADRFQCLEETAVITFSFSLYNLNFCKCAMSATYKI